MGEALLLTLSYGDFLKPVVDSSKASAWKFHWQAQEPPQECHKQRGMWCWRPDLYGDNNIENEILTNFDGEKGKSKILHKMKIDHCIAKACLKSHIDV